MKQYYRSGLLPAPPFPGPIPGGSSSDDDSEAEGDDDAPSRPAASASLPARVEAVYCCPECSQTFSRWKFLVVHFKARRRRLGGGAARLRRCSSRSQPSGSTALALSAPPRGEPAPRRPPRARRRRHTGHCRLAGSAHCSGSGGSARCRCPCGRRWSGSGCCPTSGRRTWLRLADRLRSAAEEAAPRGGGGMGRLRPAGRRPGQPGGRLRLRQRRQEGGRRRSSVGQGRRQGRSPSTYVVHDDGHLFVVQKRHYWLHACRSALPLNENAVSSEGVADGGIAASERLPMHRR